MSFDNSRFTFNPSHDYFGVVMQQGRVLLDADWNEWLAQLAQRLHTGTTDLIGRSGVPATTSGAFSIAASMAPNQPPQITIGLGRIYVDGLLAENHGLPNGPRQPLDYTLQPYLPGVTLTPAQVTGKQFLVYLDVWQRDITSLQDPGLIEIAVGVETTGRRQTVWQVKLLDVTGLGFTLATSETAVSTADPALAAWLNLTQPSAGLLTTATGGAATAQPSACALSPATGYSGLENQLYRVEIHQGDPAPTYKWSRENSSVGTLVTGIATLATNGVSQLRVQSLGRDQVLGFRPGDWIEITDDVLELSGSSGELHRIASVDPHAKTITLDGAVSSASFPLTAGLTDASRHTRILRWDQAGPVYLSDGSSVWADLDSNAAVGSIPMPPAGTALSLEDGITVAFDNSGNSPKTFQPGDFWTFCARTADGSIQVLSKAPPQGIQHHYARLALVDFSASQPAIIDCRRHFPALSNPCIHVTGVFVGGTPLANDGTVTIQSLINSNLGISVGFDAPLDPSIVVHPPNANPANANSPILSLTLDLPSANNPGSFTSITLPSVLTIGPPNTLQWKQGFGAISNTAIPMLEAQIPLPPGQPILGHLTLRGNAIWAAGNHNLYLNGAGDGRVAGDFKLWFWVISQPIATLSVSTLQFPGSQSVQAPGSPPVVTPTNTLPVTLTNNGSTPLTIKSITASGDFSQTNPMMPALPAGATGTLAAGASGIINVTFAPSAAGMRTGTLSILESADPNTPLTVALSGLGVQPQLTASGPPLSFPVQIVGTTSAPQFITVASTGTSPVNVTDVSIIASPGAILLNNFSAGSNLNLPYVLQPSGSTQVQVTYHPVAAGAGNAQLQIAHNAPGSPLLLPLSGLAVAGAPVIAASTTLLNFGSQVVQASSSLSVTITNTGNTPLVFSSVVVSSAPVFILAGNTCSILQPSQTCTITVTCKPIAAGVANGQISIGHTAAGSPFIVNLQGNGVVPKNAAKDVADRKSVAKDAKDSRGDKINNIEHLPVFVHPFALGSPAIEEEAEAAVPRSAFITPAERPAVGANAGAATPPKAEAEQTPTSSPDSPGKETPQDAAKPE